MVRINTMANYRLLLNAEPFGFGPAAAIATIAPLLHAHGMALDYIGEQHTLDLQKGLPYQNIYDITGLNTLQKSELLESLASQYDYFLTAMDLVMAGLTEQIGLKTIIYDALTWYWPS